MKQEINLTLQSLNVFQLEKAIRASSSSGQNDLMDSSFGLSSFATPSRPPNRRMTSTTSSNANNSIRLIGCTVLFLIESQVKVILKGVLQFDLQTHDRA